MYLLFDKPPFRTSCVMNVENINKFINLHNITFINNTQLLTVKVIVVIIKKCHIDWCEEFGVPGIQAVLGELRYQILVSPCDLVFNQ